MFAVYLGFDAEIILQTILIWIRFEKSGLKPGGLFNLASV